MARLLKLFLFLVCCCWGCEAQFTMTQPPFVSASMGETVGISCTRSSGGIRSSWNHWYQQKPNSAPILLIYKDEERVSGIPERFSGSYDTSANSVTLTISNVRAEDEADYYCQSYDSGKHTMVQPDEEVVCQLAVSKEARNPTSSLRRKWLSLPGPSAQQQLHPLKPSEVVSAGDMVTLSCRFSGGTITDGNYPLWVQQKLGYSPRLLIDQTSRRAPDIAARFSGSKSGNTMSLTITGAMAKDKADYYCTINIPGQYVTMVHARGEARQKLS
ncbi:immunoglobulin lambda-1 light chain-like [Podarcis raffonei]|uniref:immunoglobulin lambda-1 light chain-like n=1 Tax=Podarcis raffonei TaxID=65483 RepID=UPI0023290994|nr:immunoglobulin lambda-1 light chain-like [Podarcis raffonei]